MNVTTPAGMLAGFGWMVLAQTSPTANAQTDSVAAVAIQSLWDFVVKGGPMMIPIGLCSLVALTVVVERLVSLRRRTIIPPEFLPAVTKLLDNGADARAEAVEYCRENDSPIANLFSAGIRRLGQPVEVIEKSIEDAGQRVIVKLRKYLRLLSVIASIAPLMGLLGTIFGMISAFQTVAVSGEALGKTELLAKGIYQAMITTAGGLMLAIPVLVAYHALAARADRLLGEMDIMTVDFIEEYAHAQRDATIPEPKLHAADAGEDSEDDGDGKAESVIVSGRGEARAG